jgi:CDP-2,3-bis-(O-geranylgeranyl)-sn-glycerol synthase
LLPEDLTWPLTLKLLLLSLVANGAPVLSARLLGEHWSLPLDGGRHFFDERPILGNHKTVRGFVFSLLACSMVATTIGYPWLLGLMFGAASMTGDALSSFTKRRLNVPPGDRFVGLDQIPEILLPLLLLSGEFGLDWLSIIVLTGLFIGGSLPLSQLAFRLGIKERPY